MMQTPFPTGRDYIPQSLPGHDIASYPVLHQGAVDATYVACDPLHKDVILAAYAALGWQVENVTDEDYRNVQARRAQMLLLDAAEAADRAGDATLCSRLVGLYNSRHDGASL